MPTFLRDRSGRASVTNTELFFDLVYVFAITQMTSRLVHDPTWTNAAQTLLLLAMVWIAWVYTTWVTNWLDPDQLGNRLMLVIVMLASLVMSAGIPGAFGGHGEPDHGLWVGGAWAAIQFGRTAYVVWASRGTQINTNFTRILSWCTVSSALVVTGAVLHGPNRVILWIIAVLIDVTGGFAKFWTPWLGASKTTEWTIDGGHFAERCQLFMIIALGESVVATGAPFSTAARVDVLLTMSFVGAFAGVVALFWLYFDRSAQQGSEAIESTDDPGRLATSAYHYIHPLMIAGIIATAAGDESVLHDPGNHAVHGTAWFVAGGSALFVLGHAAFVRLIRRMLSLPHLITAALLLLLAMTGAHLTGLTVGLVTLVVLIGLLLADRILDHRRDHA